MIPREFPCLPLDMRYILSYKAIIINAVSYWHNAKTQTCLHERLIFLSYSRDYESISLCAATLVQMKIRMNGKVSAISNESYYFGSIIFVIPTKHLKCVKHKAICGSFNWQREKPKSHRRFSIFDSNHFQKLHDLTSTRELLQFYGEFKASFIFVNVERLPFMY